MSSMGTFLPYRYQPAERPISQPASGRPASPWARPDTGRLKWSLLAWTNYFWPRDAPVLALPEMHRDSTTSASALSHRGGHWWLHAISVAARCSRTIRVALSDPRCATCDAEGTGRPPRFTDHPTASRWWWRVNVVGHGCLGGLPFVQSKPNEGVTEASDLPEQKNSIAIQYRNPSSRHWQTTCAVSIFAVP